MSFALDIICSVNFAVPFLLGFLTAAFIAGLGIAFFLEPKGKAKTIEEKGTNI